MCEIISYMCRNTFTTRESLLRNSYKKEGRSIVKILIAHWKNRTLECYDKIIIVITHVVTQAIKDAKEREMLLEDKEIQLFADAKKVQTCGSHVLMLCIYF